MPRSPRRLVAVVPIRSRKSSASSRTAARRRGERLDDRHRQPRGAAGRVDDDVGRVAQATDPRAVLAPGRQALPPELGLLRGVRLGRDALAPGVVLVDPRREVLRAEIREGQAEVREVALRVDDERGDAVEQRLLEEPEAEPGLAAPGHADAHRVGDEVLGVVEEGRGARLLRREIVRPAEVEDAELLEVRRGRGRGGRCGRRRLGGGARGPGGLGSIGSTRAGRHERLPAWVVP